MSDRKTILVTGCSSGGIGAAVALVLAKKGHHVFATARNLDKIPSELAESVHVTIIKLDVTSPESIASAVEKVGHVTRENDSYGLDAIVNNAGVGYTTPLLDADIEQARMVYETNVFGSLRVVQAFAGLLIARKGRLVNICSVAAMLHAPWMGTLKVNPHVLETCMKTLLRVIRDIRFFKGCADCSLRYTSVGAEAFWGFCSYCRAWRCCFRLLPKQTTCATTS